MKMSVKQIKFSSGASLIFEEPGLLTSMVENKYCFEYEQDCNEVTKPELCFLGGDQFINGELIITPMANGLCKELEIRRKLNN